MGEHFGKLRGATYIERLVEEQERARATAVMALNASNMSRSGAVVWLTDEAHHEGVSLGSYNVHQVLGWIEKLPNTKP